MKTGQEIDVGGLPFRLCLWFIKNPGKDLFAEEIAERFDVQACRVTGRLAKAYEAGWLNMTKRAGLNVYSAGPKLEAAR